MSLPQASKDISDHPKPGTVTEPVNYDKKKADVDRKLHFYGVVTALRESRLPTNDQIDAMLDYTLGHSPVDIDALSPSGRQLILDSREIVDGLRAIVRQKNADELLQNFVWHTRRTVTIRAKKDPNELIPVDQNKVQADTDQAAQHLRTLATLVLTNAEVRKLVGDFGVVGRDLLAKSAGKAAELARPNEERLRQVDQAGPDQVFISEGGRQVGPDETPVPEVPVPATGHRIAQDPRNKVVQGTSIKTDQGDEVRGDEAVYEAQHRKNEAVGRACQEAYAQKEDIEQNITENEGADVSTRKGRVKSKMAGMRDHMLGRVPQEHKDKANEHATRVKNFLSDEYFPPERRDQLIFRIKKVIIECQNHKDYQESIRWLLDTGAEYVSHGQTINEHGRDSHRQLTSDSNIQRATYEFRTLLERFANGVSLDIVGDAMRALYQDSQNDEGLRHWFHDVNEYVRECLMSPGYVLDDQCNEHANELREVGRAYYDNKYKGHFDNLWNSLADWFRGWADDPLNRRFGQDWARLTKDLLFDSEGSLKYKPELWKDIRNVVVPNLVENIGYIPIPRIEYTDDSLDLVLENLALSGKNVFPNIISLDVRNFMKFSPYNVIGDEQHHEFTLTLGQIQADLRDVAFYYHKKTGMPKMSDSGLADLLLGGTGLTITAHLATAHDPASVFAVKDVQVKVHTLKFAVRDSKHDVLYKTLAPLATSLVKKQLQKALGGAVRTALEYLDGELVAVRDEMREAKAGDGSRTEALKQHLAAKKDAAQDKTEETKQKTGQFKVVAQPGNELLPDKGHSDGWIKRAAERVGAAKSGEEWRSDAYSVV
ncbi:uncharacterized protein LAESUDRAFT_724022 [Laetiporus sulphureus 93-53]|uniref:Uncharacterized protein n=1 Tax=Laetiporus sulphureus 93-53 TaxID=1314785 RepID=A0A165F731_9APHY|nr:uncharacterized protein LAESUDRAFT_724022 [Laetiporus sulphureus 93-53]KZT08513.1 hypothetical protein LAESUDRAFT_724022 [Laetiporus sulphureus 93-53]